MLSFIRLQNALFMSYSCICTLLQSLVGNRNPIYVSHAFTLQVKILAHIADLTLLECLTSYIQISICSLQGTNREADRLVDLLSRPHKHPRPLQGPPRTPYCPGCSGLCPRKRLAACKSADPGQELMPPAVPQISSPSHPLK